MRITFVLPYAGLAGGIRVVAIYAQSLQRRGHQVFVVSTPWVPPSLRGRTWAIVRRWLHRLNPRPEPLDPTHFDKVDVEHVKVTQVRPVTDADVPDADVVVATWWETAEWVAAFSPGKGAKAYFIQGFEAHRGQPDERVKNTWKLPMHKIVVARWLADLARTEFRDTEVSVVPNSVDLEQFHAPPRNKQPLPVVGLVYSSVSLKGCDICLKAYDVARQRVSDLELVAFGQKSFWTTALPKSARYWKTPRQSELKNIYALCDVWLFGSRSEGFGLPILEAMACRTPVIATPAGAAPELLAGGGGILVKPEDPHDMAEAIERIAAMPAAQWKEMSEAAYATASRYSWDDAVTRFEAALYRAIERSRRGELAPT